MVAAMPTLDVEYWSAFVYNSSVVYPTLFVPLDRKWMIFWQIKEKGLPPSLLVNCHISRFSGT